MDFVPLVAMAALVVTVINFLKDVRVGDVNAALTQLSVWVGGAVVVLLVAQTDWAGGLVFADFPLSDMNFASIVFLGVSVGSVASVGYDLGKSIDNSDTAASPHLFK